MPPSTHDRGRYIEDHCADRLIADGWDVLARNVRTHYGEIDLLAIDPTGNEPVLVAVEVKTQAAHSWVDGEELLRPRQRARLARTLEWIAAKRRWREHLRIDLAVATHAADGSVEFEWFRDVESA